MFGTGTGEDAGSGVQPLSYEGSSSDTDALGKQVKDLYLNSPSDLPTSGCASYDGVIAFATTKAVLRKTSRARSLDVDFEDSELTGQASNLGAVDEERLDGSLAVINGDLDLNTDPETEPTYGFDMNGTLSDQDGAGFQVAAGNAGTFLEDDGEATFGVVVGEVPSHEGVAYLKGFYVAT